MKFHFKHLLPFLIFFAMFISLVFAIDDSTISKIIVVEGRVVCFDVPKEFAGEELFIITIINREDEETGKGDKDGEIVRFYIPDELRNQIGERIQPNAYGLCAWNTRKTNYKIH